MQEMDGLELAESLRGENHKQPIVLLSPNIGFAKQDPARQHIQAMLQKPVARKQLFAALSGLEGAFPVAVGEKDLAKKPETKIAVPDRNRGANSPRAMRVLAAEDNKTNRLVFSKMVKTLDIDLKFAENGKEAIELYKAFDPDIVFMDISMPEMDGKEATTRIREIEEDTGCHVPVVAMTAHAMDGDKEDIIASGLDHYLTKPLRKEAIAKHISQACPADAREPLEADQVVI